MLRIKELREEKNLSQKEVADAIKTNQSTVARWENGEHFPSGEFVIKLADLFQCTADYLLGREDDFGNISSNANLSPDEENLLQLYRRAYGSVKNMITEDVKRAVLYSEMGRKEAENEKADRKK
ncbi:MAG: helix-turn-helix transcriptional regulator [Clostridia bacterium]|nr:helix-turn-helix transcriptional regulator [Clostridia bacterium]